MKNYILFDTEFTAWEGSQKRNWSNDNEYREIIQISALKIKNGKILDKLNIYVKPCINKILSDYIINLTGITNYKIMTQGVSFKNALEEFYIFSENYELYSYGNDYDVILENMKINKIMDDKYFKIEKKFKDFKDILKKYTNINVNKYSSGTIYKALDIKINNHKIHDSQSDIYSMYKVCEKIL